MKRTLEIIVFLALSVIAAWLSYSSFRYGLTFFGDQVYSNTPMHTITPWLYTSWSSITLFIFLSISMKSRSTKNRILIYSSSLALPFLASFLCLLVFWTLDPDSERGINASRIPSFLIPLSYILIVFAYVLSNKKRNTQKGTADNSD